jgi:hypothetical protein
MIIHKCNLYQSPNLSIEAVIEGRKILRHRADNRQPNLVLALNGNSTDLLLLLVANASSDLPATTASMQSIN